MIVGTKLEFESLAEYILRDYLGNEYESLERKGFIYTEPTKVKTKDGRTHNGSFLYTIQPIGPIEEAHFERQIALANAKLQAQKALEKYEKKHGRS